MNCRFNGNNPCTHDRPFLNLKNEIQTVYVNNFFIFDDAGAPVAAAYQNLVQRAAHLDAPRALLSASAGTYYLLT